MDLIQENKIQITVNMFGLFSSFAKTGQMKFGLAKPTNLEASGLYKESGEDGKVKDGIFILVNETQLRIWQQPLNRYTYEL